MIHKKNGYDLTGNFFEDFKMGQSISHGVPRTITESDATLYLALTGSRFALHCASTIAIGAGFKKTPLDNLLVFHIAFGKTVNDISLNAVANLGYAEVVFHQPCYANDTLTLTSEVIGLKENSNGKTGVVYVHSTASNQSNQQVLEWKRWVMVNKRNATPLQQQPTIPSLQETVSLSDLKLPDETCFSNWDNNHSDNQPHFDAFKIGETIFHRDGMTINNSDHSLATRLYQNNARVHFDQTLMNESNHGKRLVYGGHIISICRALSYNGLGNALWLSSINAGTHCNPCFAGDTIYCQSEILGKQPLPNRSDLAVLRIRMLGFKNNTPDNMGPLYSTSGSRTKYHNDVVLDLDYYALTLT